MPMVCVHLTRMSTFLIKTMVNCFCWAPLSLLPRINYIKLELNWIEFWNMPGTADEKRNEMKPNWTKHNEVRAHTSRDRVHWSIRHKHGWGRWNEHQWEIKYFIRLKMSIRIRKQLPILQTSSSSSNSIRMQFHKKPKFSFRSLPFWPYWFRCCLCSVAVATQLLDIVSVYLCVCLFPCADRCIYMCVCVYANGTDSLGICSFATMNYEWPEVNITWNKINYM